MPKKILLVDDDPRILTIEKTILTQGGYAVDTAPDGVVALEKIKASHYDGIVLDILMPYMNGYEVAKEIKKLEDYKSTPIVMITAATERDALKQGFGAGAVVFMNKPFTPAKLISVLNTVVK
jgi:DNA-binding response OmpR family regulator